ncbi:hypothetical protein [Halocatena pleomorpha]|uniref:ArsR family transcriptional regulator n=1 Tax=Halocatena pleomorpha TaxID=1785090 RepID=A0A3P3RBW9_9EURY|nr:hypothetical protein [Halocatena pleomorpha]RRJ29963.1 hypothetical protein EIK79_11470 [Halocatena pleomorpha]
MSSLPADDREDELNDEDIPTVAIPGFDPEDEADTDTLFEGHPFLELLTPNSRAKIILAMLRVRGDKLREADICDAARISHDTWNNHKDILADKYGVIEHVLDIENSPLYTIPEDSELADLLEKVIGTAAQKEREWLIEQRDK